MHHIKVCIVRQKRVHRTTCPLKTNPLQTLIKNLTRRCSFKHTTAVTARFRNVCNRFFSQLPSKVIQRKFCNERKLYY